MTESNQDYAFRHKDFDRCRRSDPNDRMHRPMKIDRVDQSQLNVYQIKTCLAHLDYINLTTPFVFLSKSVMQNLLELRTTETMSDVRCFERAP